MAEDTDPEPAGTDAEDIEVVAHSEDDEELEAGCIVNGSSSL